MKQNFRKEDMLKILTTFDTLVDQLEAVENNIIEMTGTIVDLAHTLGIKGTDKKALFHDPRVSNSDTSDSRPRGPGEGGDDLLEGVSLAQIKSSTLPLWFIKWLRYLDGYEGPQATLIISNNSIEFGFTKEASKTISDHSDEIKDIANYHLTSPITNFENFCDELEYILDWSPNDAACLALQLTIEYYNEVG